MTQRDPLAALRLPGSRPWEQPETPLSQPVPAQPGRPDPQKTALSQSSRLSQQSQAKAERRFPLTDYLVALMSAPDVNRTDPDEAAHEYGLSPQVCREYHARERSRRWAR